MNRKSKSVAIAVASLALAGSTTFAVAASSQSAISQAATAANTASSQASYPITSGTMKVTGPGSNTSMASPVTGSVTLSDLTADWFAGKPETLGTAVVNLQVPNGFSKSLDFSYSNSGGSIQLGAWVTEGWSSDETLYSSGDNTLAGVVDITQYGLGDDGTTGPSYSYTLSLTVALPTT